MAVLKAHIDDSGSEKTAKGHFVLGGLVAPPPHWGFIEDDWEAELDKWGLEHFKMSDAHSREGQFHGWEEKRRDACVDAFLKIAVSQPLIPGAAAMKRSDFEAALQEHALRTHKAIVDSNASPYPFLMIFVVSRLCIGAEALRQVGGCKGKMLCIFDVQHSVGRAVSEMRPSILRNMPQIKGIAQVSSTDFVALQVADMWAWAVRRKLEFGKPTRIYTALTRDKEQEPEMKDIFTQVVCKHELDRIFLGLDGHENG